MKFQEEKKNDFVVGVFTIGISNGQQRRLHSTGPRHLDS
jgi:hypothetical protein